MKSIVLTDILGMEMRQVAMLGTFRDEGVNLTRIQSRPSRRRAWDYVFFLDCEGHVEDAPVSRALEALRTRSRHVQVLGSFPAASSGAASTTEAQRHGERQPGGRLSDEG